MRRKALPQLLSLPGLVALFPFALLLTAMPLVSSSASAQDSQTSGETGAGSIEKVTEIEGISEYLLENGVRLLLFPDNSKDVVTVNMTVFVGSRHEGYGEAGMAHLLEHMLFKDTASHVDIPKLLKDRGASFNGTTWLDRTNYYETLPASEDNLRFALELEADRLLNSLIKGEELESEMTVVRNEFEMGENSPSRILMQRMQAAAFEWHNYGKTTIGNRSDIERVPVVSLRQFYRKYYRPDNVMLVVAGKFDKEKALELVGETFGKLTSPDTPIDPTYTTEPAQDGERTVVLRRVGEVQMVGACYHVPSGSHPEFAAVRALAIILRDEPSGRLYREMVETKIASNAYAFSYALAEPGLLMAIAEVPADASIESAREKLIEILEQSFDENAITQEEVERAKQQILKQRELEATNTDRLAVSLSEWAAQGDWRLYFLYRDVVEQLNAEAVQEVAKRYLVRNNRTVGLFIPSESAQRVTIPEAPDLMARLEGYQGRETIQEGEQFDPEPEVIEARTLRGSTPGGMKFALLPKKTRGEAVFVHMAVRFGTEESMRGRRGPIELLGWLMSRGTTKLGFQELQDELLRLRADLRVNSTPGLLEVTIKTKREHLSELTKLLRDVLRNPKLDAAELDVIKRQTITQLQQSLNEPNSLAPRAVRRKLSTYDKGDIRYVPTIQEEIDMYRAVQIDEIRELYDELLSGQFVDLSVVGDFDVETVKADFQSLFTDWETNTAYVRVGRPANASAPGELIRIETPDKANSLLYSSMQLDLKDDDPRYASLVLANFILGGGSLSSRLGNRVRQKEGLSYGVRSGVSPRAKDGRVDFTLYAITNPANMDLLLEVIQDEIKIFRSEGITDEELAEAKNAYLQSQKRQRSNDGTLANELLGTIFMGRTMKFAREHIERIEAADVESVNAAIREFITWDKLVAAAAGDFASVEEKEE